MLPTLSGFFIEEKMKEKILVITYHLNLVIRRLESLAYKETNYEVEQRIQILNEKIYDIADVIEDMQLLLE